MDAVVLGLKFKDPATVKIEDPSFVLQKSCEAVKTCRSLLYPQVYCLRRPPRMLCLVVYKALFAVGSEGEECLHR